MSRSPRDVDSASRARFVRILAWGAVGLFIGGLLGVRVQLAMPTHRLAPFFPAIFALGLPLFMIVSTYTLMNLSGGMARTLHYPAGSSEVRRSDHSRAAALVVAARYEEAIEAYEAAARQDRSDPVPLIHIARLYRDKLRRYDDAIRCMKRARDETPMDPGLRALTLREITEMYVYRLEQPARALPELARVAEEHPETDEGRWAARTLDELRRDVFGTPSE